MIYILCFVFGAALGIFIEYHLGFAAVAWLFIKALRQSRKAKCL